MTISRLLSSCAIVIVILLAGERCPAAATNDALSLEQLARAYAPGCRIETNSAGKSERIISADGSTLDLAKAAAETPAPTNSVVGYWFSSSMDFLSAQKHKAATAGDAVGIVQLLHTLCQRDIPFVRQKLYAARKFGDAWVVEVDHDFTNYPGRIQMIYPYELVLDKANRVERLRQRCYHYLGSKEVYTNTVITVYEREIKRDRGRNYPEALFDELRVAWEKEKPAAAPAPK